MCSCYVRKKTILPKRLNTSAEYLFWDVYHDDVMTWKRFPHYWRSVREIDRWRWIPSHNASNAMLWCVLYLPTSTSCWTNSPRSCDVTVIRFLGERYVTYLVYQRCHALADSETLRVGPSIPGFQTRNSLQGNANMADKCRRMRHRSGLENKTTWWRHQMEIFSALLVLLRGIYWSPVNSPHKGQWRGALKFS